MEELTKIINDLKARIELLERLVNLKNITIPDDGKIVVDKKVVDPTAENGRIYYNTASNKYKVTENGVWKTITTA
jgi:hypothetical protein